MLVDQLQKWNKERIQKFREAVVSWYTYQNELDRACFPHDMVYGDFKDLRRRAASDRILHDKPFDIAKNHKYDGYQRSISSKVYKVLDKKTAGGSATLARSETLATKINLLSNKELAEEFIYKSLENFKKEKYIHLL